MIILNLPALIAIAVIYLLAFPLGALLCSYVSMKLLAAVNVILGVLGVLGLILFDIVGDKIVSGNRIRYRNIFLILIHLYIYVPNHLLYFKTRKVRKQNGVVKEKYAFKNNALMAGILTACHFPIFNIYAGLFVFISY